MKQNYSFIAATYYLEISTDMNKGTLLTSNGLRISKSKNLQNIVDDFFGDSIGKLEYYQLLGGPYYYAKGTNEDEVNLHEREHGLNLIDYLLVQIQTFNNILWLIKDHSINTEFGYLKVVKGINFTSHSNSRTTTFYNAKGLQETTTFSVQELFEGKELKDSIYKDEGNVREHEPYIQMTERIYSSKRIERSFYFLQVARSESFLPLRISNFVTVLETLLSTTSTEVTHKLKERMAWVLGESVEQRIHIFKLVADVYSIRSNCVHGNNMPKKYRTHEKLSKLSVEFEELVRKLFLKIINDEELAILYAEDNDGNIENWLNEKCLGAV